jgi:hypothetical protein
MKPHAIVLVFLLAAFSAFSQEAPTKKFTFSGYGEMYYSYDFSNPQNHEKSSFLYNHKRHNEVNANLILLKANYTEKKYRANLSLMAGNFSQYNWSNEPAWAQFIYEANVGIKISDKQNIWLDAGIMPSHIGFESGISADCWTLTRSILAENSPYYETGAKLSYLTKNEKLYLSAMILNGWQKIRKPNFIQNPSFGMQATYRPNEKITFNYSNFLGSDKPDSINAFRHFHNLYIQYEPTDEWGIIAGFDIGNETSSSDHNGTWYSPVLIVRKKINSNIKAAIRGEYYCDKNQIIVSTKTPNGFQTFGVSSNIDFNLNEKMTHRIEGKLFQSKDAIFSNNKRINHSITTNLTIQL